MESQHFFSSGSQITEVKHSPFCPSGRISRSQILRFQFSPTKWSITLKERTLKSKLDPWFGFTNKFLSVSLLNMNEYPMVVKELKKAPNVKTSSQLVNKNKIIRNRKCREQKK